MALVKGKNSVKLTDIRIESECSFFLPSRFLHRNLPWHLVHAINILL